MGVPSDSNWLLFPPANDEAAVVDVPASDAAREASAFVRSSLATNLGTWDQDARGRAPEHITVAMFSKWPELDRVARSVQLVDREVRRCAQAWQNTYDASEAAEDPTLFGSPAPFLEHLLGFPSPCRSGDGSLQIRALDGLPASFLLEPHGFVWALLAEWPATSAAYGLSVLGDVEIVRHDDCLLEGAYYATELSALGALRDATKERWKGSQPGAVRTAGGDGRKGMYRAIADSPNIVDSDRRADIELVIHRIFNQHEQDLTIGRIIR